MTAQTKRAKQAKRGSEPAAALLERRRFTLDEYERMIKARILYSGERVELLEGDIVCMAALGSRHVACTRRFDRWFTMQLPRSADVRCQGPIRLPPGSEPEPDIAVVRWRDDDYETRHPDPEDVLLLIEIADSSLARDRGRKISLYAAAGISEVWLADLTKNQLVVHRRPVGARYADVQTIGRDGTIAPLAFPELLLPLAEIFR